MMLTTPMTSTQQPEVTTYNLCSGITGRRIRKATMVTLPSGEVVKFYERIPTKREAIATAYRWVAEGLA